MSIPFLILPADPIDASYVWEAYLLQYFKNSSYPILDLLHHNLDYWKSLKLIDSSNFIGILTKLDMQNNKDRASVIRVLLECTDLNNAGNNAFLQSSIRRFSNADSFNLVFGINQHTELSELLTPHDAIFDFYINRFDFGSYNALSLITYYLQDNFINVDNRMLNKVFEASYTLETLSGVVYKHDLGSNLWINHLEHFLMITPDIEVIFKRVSSLDLKESTKILFFIANAEVIISDQNYSPESVMSNDIERNVQYEVDKKSRYEQIIELFKEYYPKVANTYFQLKSMGINDLSQLGTLIDLDSASSNSVTPLPFIY